MKTREQRLNNLARPLSSSLGSGELSLALENDFDL